MYLLLSLFKVLQLTANRFATPLFLKIKGRAPETEMLKFLSPPAPLGLPGIKNSDFRFLEQSMEYWNTLLVPWPSKKRSFD